LNSLIRHLLADRPVLTDGGWATELQRHGLPIGECPDAWNVTHPDRVEAVAHSYIEAGSRVILTNTFGANRVALARHGLAERTEEINRAGAAISRQAAGKAAHVFASIGPTGSVLRPGEVSEHALRAAFAEQTHALAAGGADGIVIETMSDLTEAILALEAALATGLPVIACMSFGGDPVGGCTLLGVTPEEAAEALAAAGADGIGANCGDGAAELLPICRRLRAATDLPLWLTPNAGLPEVVGGRAQALVYPTTPAEWVAAALALVEAGADFIGGCCGTGPAFIRALAQGLDGQTGP
jgi:5-methyltetrahydrofolate--homocysteine methyltransferase